MPARERGCACCLLGVARQGRRRRRDVRDGARRKRQKRLRTTMVPPARAYVRPWPA